MEPMTDEAISARSNESNLYVSISCLTYLSFDEFDRGPVVHDNCLTENDTTEIIRHYENVPFLQYCAQQCHRHVRQLDDELQATPGLQNAFLRLATSKHKMNLWSAIHPEFFELPSGSFWISSVGSFSLPLIFGFNSFSQALIDHGLSGNGRVNRDNSALLTAIEFQKETLVRFLVENGADVNARGGYYRNPLQAAATKNVEIVRYLVENGADVNAQGGYYGNPLQAAATTNVKIVRYLVENGADVNAQGGKYGNPLQATATTNVKIVRHLAENGADVNAQAGFFGNPLQAASCWGHDIIVRFLVENGADLNAQGGEYGSDLSAAEGQGKISTVRFLLENGATRSSKDGG
jgi:ankyrin repeat protein